MYYELTLYDGNYNKLFFKFETLGELNNFLEMAFDSTDKKLKATIEVITEDEESEEEEC